MINFNFLHVNRLIIHTIVAKQEGQDSATVRPSQEISTIDESGLEIIKTRLIDAAGRHSKAFELKIENTNVDSFFDLTRNLSELDNSEFIQKTYHIADLLADSQRTTSIPGGYLLVLDCMDTQANKPVIIAIKAEPHEALQFSTDSENNQITVLNRVFLSPSQKLYKIGVLFEKEEDSVFSGFLYDDQFRTDSHPAEYFYKDFLGFSIGENSKIQSHRFFDKTTKFIYNNVQNTELKFNLLLALKNEFVTSQDVTISPMIFADTFMPMANGIRDAFIQDVCSELPHSIVKSNVLIKTRLNKRKIDFPSNINIAGPEIDFDNRVEIIDNSNSISELDANNSTYTIIKILGKPFTIDE